MTTLPEDIKLISDTLWSTQDQTQQSGFLEDILTPQEIQAVAERIKLCQLLLQGKTQRDVAQQLGVSITTVTRGARMINY